MRQECAANKANTRKYHLIARVCKGKLWIGRKLKDRVVFLTLNYASLQDFFEYTVNGTECQKIGEKKGAFLLQLPFALLDKPVQCCAILVNRILVNIDEAYLSVTVRGNIEEGL